jgi:hypothetical protein
MGHGYLFPKLSKDMESTINLLHVAALNSKFGISFDEAFQTSTHHPEIKRTVDDAAVCWMMQANFKNKKPMSDLEAKYQHKGHADYVEIARLFGWDVLHDYWRAYMVDEANGIVKRAIDDGDKDSILFRLSKAVGEDITPLFQFYGIYPDDPEYLVKLVAGKKIKPSIKIYRTLKRYQSLIPDNKEEFQAFALHYWGDKEEVAKSNYATIWDAYDETYAELIFNNVQDVIDQYFPDGPPAIVGANDKEAPKPNVMTFSVEPTASGEQSVTMRASKASDTSWVQYYFTNTSGNGNDSKWQISRRYSDTGLKPGTTYSYTVKTRDYSPAQNTSAPSKPVSVTTRSKDTTDPKPSKMSMKEAPKATSPSTIYMVAETATDDSGIEYNFTCTSGGGHNSGWQDNAYYTDVNLKAATSYSYSVTVRDKSPQHNSTEASAELSATTMEATSKPYIVMNKPVYAVGEDIVLHYVDPQGKEGSWIAIYSPPSDVAESETDGLQYQYVDEHSDNPALGALTFNAMGPGKYQVRFHYDDDYPIVARVEFTVE